MAANIGDHSNYSHSASPAFAADTASQHRKHRSPRRGDMANLIQKERDGTQSLERGIAGFNNHHHRQQPQQQAIVEPRQKYTRHGSLNMLNHRDRSLDRSRSRESDHHHHQRSGTSPGTTAFDYDSDYPRMGARSLKREPQAATTTNLARSRSIDYKNHPQLSPLTNSPNDRNSDSSSVVFNMEVQIQELNRQCEYLQQELDHTKDKLSSCMNSIKIFWSPELKKERAMRKEESTKLFQLTEKVKCLEAENKRFAHLMQDPSNHSSVEPRKNGLAVNSPLVSQEELDVMQQEKDKQNRELKVLKRTVSEMELRIDTQKNTLVSKEETITRLLGIIQNNKESVARTSEQDRTELEKLKLRVVELEQTNSQLEAVSSQKELTLLGMEKKVLDSKQDKVTIRELEEKSRKLESTVRERDAAVKNLEKEGVELRKQKSQVASLEQKNKELETAISDQKSAAKRSEQKLSELEKLKVKVDELQQNNRHLETLVQNNEAASKRMEQYRSDAENYKLKMNEFEQKNKHMEMVIQMKETTVKKMEQDHNELEKLKVKISELEQNQVDQQEQMKQTLADDQDERVAELEEALRESVKITAQRECVVQQLQDQLEIAKQQMDYLSEELEHHRDESGSRSKKVQDLELQIEARNKQLKFLQGDRGKQMSELYEMKQEALSAAITEKDAHIALLEIAPNKQTENIDAVERLTKEKILLQQQLKDLSEKRLKLLHLDSSESSSDAH